MTKLNRWIVAAVAAVLALPGVAWAAETAVKAAACCCGGPPCCP